MNLALLATFLSITFGAASAARVVCYYASWATYYSGDGAVTPEDLDPNLCTHINYAFALINEDGSVVAKDSWLDVDQGGYYRVTDLKQNNPNLKVLLSIGGGSAPPEIFSRVAADPEKRSTMVQSARNFVETYNFDGVDLDWEIPEAADRNNFIALLQDFRNDFDRNGWELTAAVRSDVSKGYDVPRISQLLTFINIMTYDMYGPWSKYTGQNSPLYPSSVESEWQRANLNMDGAVTNWINAGAEPSKVLAGIAFYGHTFTLADPNNNGIHAPFTGPGRAGPVRNSEGSLVYLEFCQMNNWNCVWDDEQKVPICRDGDQWLGTDNEDSIRYKLDYIKSRGLGGAMIWSVDQDDAHGRCGTAWPLLRLVADNLK